jgi:hypothetical protein
MCGWLWYEHGRSASCCRDFDVSHPLLPSIRQLPLETVELLSRQKFRLQFSSSSARWPPGKFDTSPTSIVHHFMLNGYDSMLARVEASRAAFGCFHAGRNKLWGWLPFDAIRKRRAIPIPTTTPIMGYRSWVDFRFAVHSFLAWLVTLSNFVPEYSKQTGQQPMNSHREDLEVDSFQYQHNLTEWRTIIWFVRPASFDQSFYVVWHVRWQFGSLPCHNSVHNYEVQKIWRINWFPNKNLIKNQAKCENVDFRGI